MAKIVFLALAAIYFKSCQGVNVSLAESFANAAAIVDPVDLPDYEGIGPILQSSVVYTFKQFFKNLDISLSVNMADSLRPIENSITSYVENIESAISYIDGNTTVGYLDQYVNQLTEIFTEIIGAVTGVKAETAKISQVKKPSTQDSSPRIDWDITIEERFTKLPQLINADLQRVLDWLQLLLNTGFHGIRTQLDTLQQEFRVQDLQLTLDYARWITNYLEMYEPEMTQYCRENYWSAYSSARDLLRSVQI